MENQISIGDQNTQQIGQNPVSQSVQIPEKPKVNYWMISTLILAVLFFGIFGLYVFSIYRTNQSGLNLTPTQPPLSSEVACSQDDDCVIGIQATSCCSCPEAISIGVIGTKNWEQYEFGKDYSSQQTKQCGGTVACKPCELPNDPICQNGQCRLSSSSENQNVSSTNPTDLFKYIGKVENSKLQYAQLEAWSVEINTKLLTDKTIQAFRINLFDENTYEVERDKKQMQGSVCDIQECTWIGYISGRSCMAKNTVTGKCSPGETIIFTLNNNTIAGTIPAVAGINQYAYSIGGMTNNPGPFVIKIDPTKLGPD